MKVEDFKKAAVEIMNFFNLDIPVNIVDFDDEDNGGGRIYQNIETKEFYKIEMDRWYIEEYEGSNPLKALVHEITHTYPGGLYHSKRFYRTLSDNIERAVAASLIPAGL